MLVIKYAKKQHGDIIQICSLALKQGKVVAYPTDTCYGLAASVESGLGIKKLYKIKERDFNKPVHVVLPSLLYGKKIVEWNIAAEILSKKFLPGPLTLVLPLKSKKQIFKKMSAGSNFLGLRLPKNEVALGLAKKLGCPITATSANPSAHLSGGYDSYTAGDILKQFRNKKYKPDIIIDFGKLKKQKPSTLVKILNQNKTEILRRGPISEKQITKTLNKK